MPRLVDYPAIRHYMTQPGKLGKHGFALAIILIIGLSLRLPNLNESIWNDEIWSTRVWMSNLKDFYALILDDWHPPFYQIFMFVWIRLFGDSELSVRMPSLLPGMSSIFLAYALASSVVGRKTALLASFLMSVSPAHIWYSQEARPYALLLFSALLSLVAYLKLKDPDSRRLWLLIYFLALFSGALTHYYLSVYVGILSIICILERHQRKKLILAMNVLILVCLAAWVIIVLTHTGRPVATQYLRAFTFRDLWRLFFTWFLFGNAWGKEWRQWQMFSAQLFFLAIFIGGLAALLFRRKTREAWSARTLVCFLFAIPAFLLVATFWGYKGYIERSVFAALPYFYIVIAYGVISVMEIPVAERFGSFGRASIKALGGVCIAVVIALNIFTIKEYFRRDEEWTVYKPNPDWRSTARYLEERLNNPAESLAIFVTIPPPELTYYNTRFRTVFPAAPGEEVFYGEVARLYWGIYCIEPSYVRNTQKFHNALSKTGARTVYLIHNKYWTGSFYIVFELMMKDPVLQYESAQSFKGIEIHKFILRADATELSQR